MSFLCRIFCPPAKPKKGSYESGVASVQGSVRTSSKDRSSRRSSTPATEELKAQPTSSPRPSEDSQAPLPMVMEQSEGREFEIAAAIVHAAVEAAFERPPYGFVSHADWSPEEPFVSHALPEWAAAATPFVVHAVEEAAASELVSAAEPTPPPYGFVSHAEWTPATPFVTYADARAASPPPETDLDEMPNAVRAQRSSVGDLLEGVGLWFNEILSPRASLAAREED